MANTAQSAGQKPDRPASSNAPQDPASRAAQTLKQLQQSLHQLFTDPPTGVDTIGHWEIYDSFNFYVADSVQIDLQTAAKRSQTAVPGKIANP